MKLLLLFTASLLLFTFSSAQQSNFVLKVGAKLEKKYIPKKKFNFYMTHSSQLRPFIKRKIDNVKYVIAFDEKSREIKYISTHDKHFTSIDGLKVDDYLEFSIEDAYIYPGWEIRASALKDDWIPLIGFNDKMTITSKDKDMLVDVETIEPKTKVKAKIIGFVKGAN
jgi:hypothetical protein